MTKKAIFILLYLTSEVILETCRDRNRSIFSQAQAKRQECMVKKTMKTWRKANKGSFDCYAFSFTSLFELGCL